MCVDVLGYTFMCDYGNCVYVCVELYKCPYRRSVCVYVCVLYFFLAILGLAAAAAAFDAGSAAL